MFFYPLSYLLSFVDQTVKNEPPRRKQRGSFKGIEDLAAKGKIPSRYNLLMFA